MDSTPSRRLRQKASGSTAPGKWVERPMIATPCTGSFSVSPIWLMENPSTFVFLGPALTAALLELPHGLPAGVGSGLGALGHGRFRGLTTAPATPTETRGERAHRRVLEDVDQRE